MFVIPCKPKNAERFTAFFRGFTAFLGVPLCVWAMRSGTHSARFRASSPRVFWWCWVNPLQTQGFYMRVLCKMRGVLAEGHGWRLVWSSVSGHLPRGCVYQDPTHLLTNQTGKITKKDAHPEVCVDNPTRFEVG